MPKERKLVFTCDYDGADTASIVGTGDALPPGWIATKDSSGGTRYYHSQEHAVLGGTVGGKTLSWVFTDDVDSTVVEQSSDDLPPGWLSVGSGSQLVVFKNQANYENWLTP